MFSRKKKKKKKVELVELVHAAMPNASNSSDTPAPCRYCTFSINLFYLRNCIRRHKKDSHSVIMTINPWSTSTGSIGRGSNLFREYNYTGISRSPSAFIHLVRSKIIHPCAVMFIYDFLMPRSPKFLLIISAYPAKKILKHSGSPEKHSARFKSLAALTTRPAKRTVRVVRYESLKNQ
jgi:hypothetical protein